MGVDFASKPASPNNMLQMLWVGADGLLTAAQQGSQSSPSDLCQEALSCKGRGTLLQV